MGVHSAEGKIIIGPGVTASGPLVVTAVRVLNVGAGTLFGPNVLVTDHYHGNVRDTSHRSMTPSKRPLHSPGAIIIGDDTQLGANCVVLGPASIGRGAIVAANAVVKGNVPDMTIYTGMRAARSPRTGDNADETGE